MAIKNKKAVKASLAKAKKAIVKKAPVKKAIKKLAKKSGAVSAKIKKVSSKKAPLKKTELKKSAAKKVVSKKKIVKSPPVKKATVKKTAAKKLTAKKTSSTHQVVKSKSAVLPISKTKKVIVSEPLIPEKKTVALSTEKNVKIGVKTKKQLITIAPQPIIEVSAFPKNKVKTLLISQPKPESDKNPYYELSKKYNLNETFRQFIKIEGLPVKDFRAQRIDILEHKAVILTSRMSVDHYFRMCNEMRVTVPESMKYFCINEATAYYLQKYIQYRKRKIFFGHQTIQDLVDVIRKNREEKFLLPAADVQKEQICDFLDAINIKYTKAVMYRTVSADLTDIKSLSEFDVLVFFTPAGIRSLKHNFPSFVQGNTRIACFGASTANTLLKNGYRLDIYAPNPKNPSMSGALDSYIKEANKR